MIRTKIIKKCLPVLCALALLCGFLAPCAGAAEAVELVSPSVIVTELTSGTTLLSSQPARRLLNAAEAASFNSTVAEAAADMV